MSRLFCETEYGIGIENFLHRLSDTLGWPIQTHHPQLELAWEVIGPNSCWEGEFFKRGVGGQRLEVKYECIIERGTRPRKLRGTYVLC